MDARPIFFVLLAAALVLAVTQRDRIQETIALVASRGIRNNNPGNIRRTGTQWRGEVPDAEKTDAEFEQFISPVWGIRAMARILKNGLAQGRDTIREIVTRWAPPVENDTESYIRSVERQTGIAADQPINGETELPGLVAAIIVHENGENPYPAQVINEGISMA